MRGRMINHSVEQALLELLDDSLRIKINNEDKIVIFSDLHIGNGGMNDDFAAQAPLFSFILENYYLKRNYNLVLNGDVEELYKFSLSKIVNSWQYVYELFEVFNSKGNLFKIIGNHDFQLSRTTQQYPNFELLNSLRLDYKKDTIFVYHGHQTANPLERYSLLAMFLIRYIFRTFDNKPFPINSSRRFLTEKIAYEFSKKNKLISILGHTHRPLFESMSKIESLQMLIENLLRQHSSLGNKEKQQTAIQIKRYKHELDALFAKNSDYNKRSSIYDEKMLVPCLFNSGTVAGKRGITGIEINKGKIALVYWFDSSRSTRYLEYHDVALKKLKNTSFYKAILKKESLEYIFSRIKLLC